MGAATALARALELNPRPARWVLLLAATVAAARLTLVWSGRAEGSLLADDAYYYFTIAHHLAEGLGATFDGLSSTNGFHPLWQLLLVPLFAFFRDDPFTPVRAALSLALLLDLGSAGLLTRITGRVAGPGAAAIAAAVWLLNPVTFLLGLRGMESSLSTLLTLVLLHAVVFSRGALVVGLLLGLAGLARTDHLLVLGPAVLLAATRGGAPDRLRRVGLTAAGAVAVMIPWLVWSQWRLGTIWQSSAQMKWRAGNLFGALPDRWDGPLAVLSSGAHALFAPWLVPLRFLAGEEMSAARVAWPLLVGVLLPTLLLLALGARASARRSETAREIWFFLATAAVAHVALFGFIGRSYATWYAHPVWALWTLAVVLAGAASWRRRRRRWVYASAAVLGLALATSGVLSATELRYVPRWPKKRFGPEFASLAERIRRNGPGPRWVLGAFDAGVRGYVALRHEEFTVVNLDGLVNNQALRALEQGLYVDYVRNTCDALLQKPDRAATFLPPEEVRRLRRVMGTGERRPSARKSREP